MMLMPKMRPMQHHHGIDALCEAALAQEHYMHQMHLAPTSNPGISHESKTLTRSDMEEPRTPTSIPDGLSRLPEPLVSTEQQSYTGIYPDLDPYGMPLVSGVSEKDSQLFLDPDGYVSAAAQVSAGSWPVA